MRQLTLDQLWTVCWSSVVRDLTKRQWGSRSSTDQDVEQGYQSKVCWYNDGTSDEILYFDNQNNQNDFPFFFSQCFLKEIKHNFSVFLPSHRNTHKSFGELEKAVEALACVLCSHSILLFYQSSTSVSIAWHKHQKYFLFFYWYILP